MQEVRDSSLRSARATQERHRPLSHPLLTHVQVLSRTRLVNILTLENKGQRLVRTFRRTGEFHGLVTSHEDIEIVVPFRFVRRTLLRVAPHSILKHLIPNVAPTGLRHGVVRSDKIPVKDGGERHFGSGAAQRRCRRSRLCDDTPPIIVPLLFCSA
jgi:hypothetical protein